MPVTTVRMAVVVGYTTLLISAKGAVESIMVRAYQLMPLSYYWRKLPSVTMIGSLVGITRQSCEAS